ncbi:MAG: NAD(P)-dependent oxidoreductase [Beijerinckiaceae bacterium]
MTGASGALGRVLAPTLARSGWSLRLTDIKPFPDLLPAGATFELADLSDAEPIRRLAEGCGTILHFGGISVERGFDEVIGPNIRGLYNIYEAARAAKARVVFASSNHTVGFHRRDEVLDQDCTFRPDGFYGLSKVYGELMGQLYFDKHGVESVLVRIGSCFPEPTDARMLATWLCYDDLASLVQCAIRAERTGCIKIWGTSNNAHMTWWMGDARAQIGWSPACTADIFAGKLADKTTTDRVVEQHQGGAYCRIDYTRIE